MGADVLEEHDREFGLFRCSNEAIPRNVPWLDVTGLYHCGSQRKRFERNGDQKNRDRDGQSLGFVGVGEFPDALVQSELSAHREENQGDDERPEVAFATESELEFTIRVAFRAFRAKQ